MALDVADITVEHREVLLRDKPTAMLAASPKGTVPVLVTDTGVLDESLDIMIWALTQHDPEDWLADGQQDRIDAEKFLTAFKDQLDRYKYASRYDPSVARGTVDTDYRETAMAQLLDLALPLATTQFLRGDRPRLIDVATFPFIRQFAAVEPAWWTATAPSELIRWLEKWLQSERFKRIMIKHPVWDEALPTG
jgi:glutathione S-transferase